MKRWRIPLLWAVVVVAGFGLGAGAGNRDSMGSLAEGNDLVAAGDLEQAVAVYGEGYDPVHPHPTLTYNLGTVLHRLDRLPEAVLWYRRSPQTDDPWLQENLWLARRSLGSQQLPGGALGDLASHADQVARAGVAVAWLFLFLVTFSDRLPRKLPSAVGLLALVLYVSAFGLQHWGPRPAVLQADCVTEGAELPAGTEAWVRPGQGGGWHIVGSANAVCPEDSVGLVAPLR